MENVLNQRKLSVTEHKEEKVTKTSLLFRGNWNGVNVRGFRAISNLKNYPDLHKYSPGADLITLIKGKEPIIRTQEQVAVEHLKSRKGVIYRDYVMFIDDEECEEFKKFETEFRNAKNECEKFLNGKISKYILDYYNFPILKFTLEMFKSNIYSVSKVRDKLSDYLLEEGIEFAISEFIKEKEGV